MASKEPPHPALGLYMAPIRRSTRAPVTPTYWNRRPMSVVGDVRSCHHGPSDPAEVPSAPVFPGEGFVAHRMLRGVIMLYHALDALER